MALTVERGRGFLPGLERTRRWQPFSRVATVGAAGRVVPAPPSSHAVLPSFYRLRHTVLLSCFFFNLRFTTDTSVRARVCVRVFIGGLASGSRLVERRW